MVLNFSGSSTKILFQDQVLFCEENSAVALSIVTRIQDNLFPNEHFFNIMTKFDFKHRKASKKYKTELALYQLPGKIFEEGDDFEAEHWYDCAPKWPEPEDGGKRAPLAKWREVAEKASSSASSMFAKQTNAKTGEAVEKALNREKTIADKVAAVTLLVHESPVHRFDELSTLMSYTRKKIRREKGSAIDALTDLFVNNLLPDDRRLVSFKDRDFKCGKGAISKRHLVYALFESNLKSLYSEFLEILEEMTKDALVHFRSKAVKTISQLLVAKPENEKILLSLLVNKLGDPERAVSSEASYRLSELITKYHPQMRLIVVKEVEQLLTRPNITRKTQYYAVLFLNQIPFTNEDVELARRFVRIYFDLFTSCLAEEEKMKKENKKLEDKKSKSKKGRKQKKKSQNKSTAKQAQNDNDAKESRLMGALLTGVNRAFPFTKPEQDDTSYDEYYNALYKVAHAHALSSATNALAFLLQLSDLNTIPSDRFYRAVYSRIMDVASASDSKQPSFLNVVYNAMKNDTNVKRLKAFSKRVLQAGAYGNSGLSAACIVLVSKAFAKRRIGILKSFISLPENVDEDEVFEDVDKEENGTSEKEEVEAKSINGTLKHEDGKKNSRSIDNANLSGEMKEGKMESSESSYNPAKREPQFANAEKTCLWEVVALSSHYHPTVSLFGNELCEKLAPTSCDGDPLGDFSEMAFLDKFSYKKPKNRLARSLHGKRAVEYRADPIPNSVEFQELAKKGEVRNDDLHFVKYFEANPDRVTKEPEEYINGELNIDGSDIDSEEEAFEKAMRAEMKRLSGENGPTGNGIDGDIDEEDEDELKAFEEAFQNEIIHSDDEDVRDNQQNLPEHLNSDDDDKQRNAKMEKKGGKRKRSTDTPISSVFAARDDYADAIDEDFAEYSKQLGLMELGEDVIPLDTKDLSGVTHKKKRKKKAKQKNSTS